MCRAWIAKKNASVLKPKSRATPPCAAWQCPECHSGNTSFLRQTHPLKPQPPPSSATHRCPAPCGLILVHLHPNPRWQLPRTHPSAHPICLEVAQPAVTCISQTFWLSTCALAVTFPSICIDMETHDIVAKIRNGRPQAVKCMQAPKNVQRREDKI